MDDPVNDIQFVLERFMPTRCMTHTICLADGVPLNLTVEQAEGDGIAIQSGTNNWPVFEAFCWVCMPKINRELA